MTTNRTKLLLALFAMLPFFGFACEASFEYEILTGDENTPPYVTFYNNSILDSEDASFNWEIMLDGAMIMQYPFESIEYLLQSGGEYTFCLNVIDGECYSEYCETIQLENFQPWDCTLTIDAITYSEESGEVVLMANPSDPTAQIFWEMQDGTTYEGNPLELEFSGEVDTYVTAFYETPACPLGVEAGFDIIGNFPTFCPDNIWSGDGQDCGVMMFEVGSFQEGEQAVWNFGDGNIVEGGHFITHQYEQSGEYQVSVYFNSNECEGVELITWVYVEGCGGDCDLNMVVEHVECGLYVLEAIVPNNGNEVKWDLNGEWYGAGNIQTFNFEENGTYQICGIFENEECNELPMWCETFVVDCFDECNGAEVSLGIDSFVNEGGPEWLVYTITDSGDATVLQGEANYSTEEPYFDLVECLPFDCYTLTIEAPEGTGWFDFELVILVDCEEVWPSYSWSSGNTFNYMFGAGNVCEPECDTEFEYTLTENGVLEAFLLNPTEDAGYAWYINGDIIADGPYVTAELAPGVYELCVQMNSIFCSTENCISFEVPGEVECPDEIIVIEHDDCYTYTFELNNGAYGNVIWDFSDAGAEGSGTSITHIYEEPGTYFVCANMMTMECDGICIEVVVPECNGDNCPDEIWWAQGETCGEINFEVGSFQPNEQAVWNFGDGTIIEGGHFTSYQYPLPGEYQVSVYFSSNDCEGVELSTWIYVEECGDCDLDIFVEQVDCGLYILEADVPNNGNEVKWSVNGDWYGAGNVQTFNFEENGVYQICGVFENENCEFLPNWCETFVVECVENDCPEEIWSGEGEDCGMMLFEVGSFQEGEEAIWHFGDGSSSEGGHFITHQYENGGEYIVTVSFTSDQCEGVTLTTVVEVESCEDDCTEVGFAFDSFVVSNGPEYIEYTLVDAFGDIYASGSAEYTENQMYHDDWACLPDGCYEMIIEGSSTLEQVEFQSAPYVDGIELPVFDVYYGENSMSYEFSINSDCNPDCNEFSLTVYNATGEDPFCTGYALYMEDGPLVHYMGVEEASEDNIYVYNFCLPDGCYEMIIDGNCDLNYGENFYVLGTGNVTVGEFEPIPDVAGTLPISVNGACEWDEGCQPVSLTVDGNYVGGAVVEWLLESEEFELEGLLPLEALLDGEFTVDWCLPEDCFTLTFNSNGPLPMEALLLELYAEELQEELGAFSMEFGEDYIQFDFGFSEDCYTSIPDGEGLSFNVYPNPSTGIFNIEGDLNSMNRVELYDMAGRLVFSENINATQRHQIDLSSLSIGLYQLTLNGESGTATSKIQILR